MQDDQQAMPKPSFRARARRGFRVISRGVATLAVVAGAVFAVQFGASELGRRADAAPAPDPAPLIPVSTAPAVFLEEYAVQRAFVGQVEPQKTVALSFELPGRLAAIHAGEGDRVRKGTVLASQDLALLHAERSRLEASREAARAQLRFAEQTVERNAALSQRGFASQAGLDEALSRQDELRARIAELDAALRDVDIRVSKSRILAPFDGRVTERLADGGETLSAGQRVFGLVEMTRPQVRVGVPLDLTEAALAKSEIDIDGTEYTATLVALRPDIDPVTRTRTAVFEIDTDAAPTFGRTARVLVTETVEARGLWLPTTSLKEGVRGQWTILTVDAGQIVRAAPVEVLHAESDRVFVRAALPEGTVLVKDGPQRVTVGQRVTLGDAR
ncbi:efflux RND transporter periplasmic adaptor subunit [Thalassococcus sp. CAU 1522]|uniref:Efflux RND transporter periplasmic adaptor subunit n=1 Tax=Thalassococcus arenae TaxID=2851652 RepID=A0ABS6N321_9RHOB|nr:efflux RND transporter periplasmic adaptor subunit [Thalassococcus arenae]MBV2358417.1 efflux RND transporter periplasmic adaptor subunit [Thalassococcus arenae]